MLDVKKRRSILIFFGDSEESRAGWWHFDKRFVHVAVILFDCNNSNSVCFMNQDVEGIQVNLNCDWLKLARCLKWMRLSGATEIYAIESTVKKQRIGGLGWYWCHTLARDLARLPIGFVINPWHLRRKILNYKGTDFIVISRYQLWAERKTIQRPMLLSANIKRRALKKLANVTKRLANLLRR